MLTLAGLLQGLRSAQRFGWLQLLNHGSDLKRKQQAKPREANPIQLIDT